MNWTDEQEAIFEWFRHGTGNLEIQALAGCTKTTSILHGASLAPERLKLVTAFNKRIADELIAKAPEGVLSRTSHSLALGYLRRRGNPEVDKWRGRTLVKKAWAELRLERPDFPEGDSEYVKLAAKLASLAKGVIPFAESVDEFYTLAINFNMAPAACVVEQTGINLDHVAMVAERAMRLAHETYEKKIDFDDMIFVPLRKGWITPAFDLICVDEAQDSNRAQMELFARALKPTGRICIVADPWQAIYQFRGADSLASLRLADRFDAKRLTLSTTFRCAKKIVECANRYVPGLRARPDAPAGKVEDCILHLQTARDGDFILSRTNAPLIEIRLALLALGKKATIIGAEDFGQAVKNIVHAIWESLDDQSADAFGEALEQWHQDERDDIDDLGDPRTAWVDDIYHAISIVAGTAKDNTPAQFIFEIATRIEQVFSGDGHGIELSTVHKAKGREADRVFILGRTFPAIDPNADDARCICGSPQWAHETGELRGAPRCEGVFQADQEWIEAERNIRYVAITRARNELYFVGGSL